MTRLHFTITFRSPFRVAHGQGGDGAHDTIDERDPLPGTSLSGVMRATAKTLLGHDHDAISTVFGSSSHPSPWRWSAAQPAHGHWHQTMHAARVRIDQDTRTAADDMLVLAQHTGADQATFSITKFRRIPADELALHHAVLKVAAQATRSLGGWRRRGFGWVSIHCDDGIDEETVRTFLGLKQ